MAGTPRRWLSPTTSASVVPWGSEPSSAAFARRTVSTPTIQPFKKALHSGFSGAMTSTPRTWVPLVTSPWTQPQDQFVVDARYMLSVARVFRCSRSMVPALSMFAVLGTNLIHMNKHAKLGVVLVCMRCSFLSVVRVMPAFESSVAVWTK